MAFCTECGAQLKDGSKFCAECGAATGVRMNANQAERKQVYEGEVHKCPVCGDILDAYETVCDSCGYERRGTQSTSSVRELQYKLENLYSRRPPREIQDDGFSLSRLFNRGQLSSVDEEIISLIKNFPIPNNKEDIMEFMILASSNIDLKIYGLMGIYYRFQQQNPAQREISDAWVSKLDQAYQKAKLALNGRKDLEEFEKIFEDKQQKLRRKKLEIVIAIGAWVFLYLISMLGIM